MHRKTPTHRINIATSWKMKKRQGYYSNEKGMSKDIQEVGKKVEEREVLKVS